MNNDKLSFDEWFEKFEEDDKPINGYACELMACAWNARDKEISALEEQVNVKRSLITTLENDKKHLFEKVDALKEQIKELEEENKKWMEHSATLSNKLDDACALLEISLEKLKTNGKR